MRYVVERSTHIGELIEPPGSFDRPDPLACFDVVDTLPPRRLIAERLRRADAELVVEALNRGK